MLIINIIVTAVVALAETVGAIILISEWSNR